MEKPGFTSLLECQESGRELRDQVRDKNPGEPWEILVTCGPTPDEDSPGETDRKPKPTTPERPA